MPKIWLIQFHKCIGQIAFANMIYFVIFLGEKKLAF